MKVRPTANQVTYIFRTLQYVNCDYEKVTELDRDIASKLISEIKNVFDRHSLKGNTRYSEEEKLAVLNGRAKDLRALKDFYKL